MTASHPWHLLEFDQLDYPTAHDLQRRILKKRIAGEIDRDILILLEHPPVFTLGRRGGRDNLQVPPEFLEQKGVPVVEIERGGNITYHGPGQLVAYPLVHLKHNDYKVVDFVTALEEVMLRTAAVFGVTAGRDDRNRGVWIGDSKLGALGISVRRSISFHGLALNVHTDLAPFAWMHPCGLPGVGVTSIEKERGRPVNMAAARAAMKEAFQGVFGISLEGEPDMWLNNKGSSMHRIDTREQEI